MRVAELRKKSKPELLRLLDELRDSTRSLRFKIASKEIKNHQLLRQTRKDIARVLTLLKEQQS